MRQSRYNYRNEGDDHIPMEENPMKTRQVRASKSREKNTLAHSTERLNKWKSKMMNIERPSLNRATVSKDEKRFKDQDEKSSFSKNESTPKKSIHASSQNPYSNDTDFKRAEIVKSDQRGITPLFKSKQSEEELNTIIKYKREQSKNRMEEIDDILKKFQETREHAVGPSSKFENSPTELVHESNPYKRSVHPTKTYYESKERQEMIEPRRHRHSDQKQKPQSERSNDSSKNISERHNLDYENLQTKNIDLYKAVNEAYSSNVQISGEAIDDFDDTDYEIITQTVENGVVVQENRHTMQPKSKSKHENPIRQSNKANKNQTRDRNEDFDTKSIEEKPKGSSSHVSSAINDNSRNDKLSHKEGDSAYNHSKKKGTFKPPNSYKPLGDPTNNLSGIEPVSLLEESQEIIVFQSDSKNNSPKTSIISVKKSEKDDNESHQHTEHHDKHSHKDKHDNQDKHDYQDKYKRHDKHEYHDKQNKHGHQDRHEHRDKNDDREVNKFKVKNQEEVTVTPNRKFEPDQLIKHHERESPGPKRDTFSNSIEKKDVEDSGSWHNEGFHEEEGSETSGDILNDNFDIKNMMPYDQRKDPNYNDEDQQPQKNKLNISYEELDDSESQGSGDIQRDDPQHLASIIEEDEEATEYQRSRSRSKTSQQQQPEHKENVEKSKPRFTNENVNAEKQPQSEDSAAKSANVKKAKQKEEQKARPKVPVVAKKSKKQNKDKSKSTDSKQKPVSETPTADIKLEVEPVPVFEAKIEDLKDDEFVEQDQEEYNDKHSDIHQTPSHVMSEQSAPSVPASEHRERKMRSPGVGPKPSKKSDADKGIAFAWYGSKQLKLIYTILHEIGDDKVVNFGEFLYFYTIINEIINMSKTK